MEYANPHLYKRTQTTLIYCFYPYTGHPYSEMKRNGIELSIWFIYCRNRKAVISERGNEEAVSG